VIIIPLAWSYSDNEVYLLENAYEQILKVVTTYVENNKVKVWSGGIAAPPEGVEYSAVEIAQYVMNSIEDRIYV